MTSRTSWIVALAGLAFLVWHRERAHDDRAAQAPALQAAVLRDGFALAHGEPGARRVIELDPRGERRREVAMPRAGDVRVVGMAGGTAIGYQDGKQVRLARLDDGRVVGSWGKAARQLCDGVASNAERFAVGWLEADDTVWIVHGPSSPQVLGDDAPAAEAVVARVGWCGVASADSNVALLWRDGDRLAFTMCTAKRCSGFPATFALDRDAPLLGFGCLRSSCLIAARDRAGVARVAFATQTGKAKWTKPIDATSQVAVLGLADRSFVAGYTTAHGAEIARFDRTGATAIAWRDPAATDTPALAWAADRLMIAVHHGTAVVHQVIALTP